jgi:hypothetical protein
VRKPRAAIRGLGFRSRRGISIPEFALAAGISLMITTAVVALTRVASLTWYQADAEIAAKQVVTMASNRIGPSIRSALRVDVAGSSSTRLVLVLPRTDGSGGYVLPLQAGDTHAFYLSDRTGSPSAPGTILWRAVNGTPDAGWSLRGTRGRIDLGTAGLAFAYDNATDPNSVQITLNTRQSNGQGSLTRTARTEIALRNKAYR